MGKKKEKQEKKKSGRKNPPVETGGDFRAVERSAAREGHTENAATPAVSGRRFWIFALGFQKTEIRNAGGRQPPAFF